MLGEERRNRIIEQLYRDGSVRTVELIEELGVSDVTLRHDLNELERRGRLVRTRGGAVTVVTEVGATPFGARLMRNKAAKQRIALAAREYVRSDQTVIFDAGTSVLALAHHLPEVSNLTVVTPGLNTAQHLLGVDGVTVVMLGGQVDRDSISVLGGAVEPLAHTAFMGAHGIDGDLDLVDVSVAYAGSKKRLLAAGRRAILLADSSKWDTGGASKVAGIDTVDLVITDDGLPRSVVRRVRQRGVEVVVV